MVANRVATIPPPSKAFIATRRAFISHRKIRTPIGSITVAAAPKQLLVYVPPHPLVAHWIGVMRSKDTPGVIFRTAAAELGRILIYEAVREWLPTMSAQIQTPLALADVTFVDPTQPIKVVPVLRAGLILLEASNTLLPATETYHVGYGRDAKGHEAKCYLNKLPKQFTPEDKILVSDTMLATGGTIVQVLDDIIARGADSGNIRIVSAVCAPPALQKLNDKYPGIKVWTGMIDGEVNADGFIVPGLGDAGDRAFGTL